MKREKERRHRAQLAAGIVASTVWNARAWRSAGDAWASPLEFCPDVPKDEKSSGPQSADEMADEIAKGLFGVNLSKIN